MLSAFPGVSSYGAGLGRTGDFSPRTAEFALWNRGILVRREKAKSSKGMGAPEGWPLISGQAALSAKDVQRWFRDAYGVIPSAADVAPIAEALNHCRFLEGQWSDKPEFKKARRGNPSRLRMQRIGEALRSLQTDLADYLKDTRKVRPNDKHEELKALIKAVDSVVPGFQKFTRSRRGPEPLLWHRIACSLKPLIVAALQSCGIKRAGFGKPTSPAIKIVQAALSYIGVEESVDTICDALRGRKKKGKLIR